MRWHPTRCLNLKLTSTAAYETMCSSGCHQLGHCVITLTSYIQPEETQYLMHEARNSTLEKHVAVVFDEPRIKDSVMHNSRIIGFVDQMLVLLTNDLLSFEQSMNNCSETKILSSTVAKYMLVIMVRGIFIPPEYPYTQLSTRGITADLLFPLMWEAIQKLVQSHSYHL